MSAKSTYVVAVLAAFAFLAPTASATAEEPASRKASVAASCYGGAISYSKPSNQGLLYEAPGKWFVTSSNCNDINVKPNTNRYMKVCFGSLASDCQASWTLAKAGQWNVIASDVLTGTRYFIWFRSNAASSGAVAD
ncbi:hypothetical protein ABZ905_34110 [Streptomyces parvus]|uniref:hypothetical protein n=1 Tax=Streptomyces parvus TaxID=66428 RepID=UPI0033C50770